MGRWQAMGEMQIREVLPGEYEDTGSLAQRAYAGYARPGGPLRDGCFGMLADVAHRAVSATVLVAAAGGRLAGMAAVEPGRTTGGTGACNPARPACGCWPWTRGARRGSAWPVSACAGERHDRPACR